MSPDGLRPDEYDDSPWTEAELLELAWEAGKRVGWDEMHEYDDARHDAD
jgi:hypothetical protein